MNREIFSCRYNESWDKAATDWVIKTDSPLYQYRDNPTLFFISKSFGIPLGIIEIRTLIFEANNIK